MMKKKLYPFTAIVGMEEVKKTLILNMIHPKIGGALLAGEKGTAKSTIVRSLAQLMGDIEVITVPLGATEDRVIGTINIEDAMKNGKRTFEQGILWKAHGNILYIDEVNLLSETLINTILDVAESGIHIIEREGISYTHPCEFILIGTMNPEEGTLNPQLLDRFGFYVEVKGVKEREERVKIIKRRLEYENNPNGFYDQFLIDERNLKDHIIRGRRNFKDVSISDEMLENIAKINIEGNTAGHRGDLILSMGALSHAMYHDRCEVILEDLKSVMNISLGHRLRTPDEARSNDHMEHTDYEHSNTQQSDHKNNELDTDAPNNHLDINEEDWNNTIQKEVRNENPSETKHDIGNTFDGKGLIHSLKDRKMRKCGSGRRSKTKTSLKIGKYVGYKIPKGKVNDIALDATLRAAAPYQKLRDENDRAFVIHKEHIREKIREQRIGNTILFLVDASGSMGVKRRMMEAKGAVLSLLNDAYQKRDTVGMMIFKGNEASVVLQPTRSIDLAHKCLKDIRVGGKTPLALGLVKSVQYINNLRIKNNEIMPVIVILSDGRGNVTINRKDPLKEVLDIAREVKVQNIKFIVVDTETGFLKLGFAKKISDTLEGDYFKLG